MWTLRSQQGEGGIQDFMEIKRLTSSFYIKLLNELLNVKSVTHKLYE